MKKSMILGILFLSSMLLVSCGKSPQEKIVGEWVNDEKQWGILIASDGIIKEIEGFMILKYRRKLLISLNISGKNGRF